MFDRHKVAVFAPLGRAGPKIAHEAVVWATASRAAGPHSAQVIGTLNSEYCFYEIGYFLFWFSFGLWPHPAVLRDFSWLCVQRLLLAEIGNCKGCWGSSPSPGARVITLQ